MRLSEKGLEFIKTKEGVRLMAYKPVDTEKYWTIGYGHYGKDVDSNMVISLQEADELLKKDLEKFEMYVNDIEEHYHFNQNQFDALVSFTFNCGKANLSKLTKDCTRTVEEIGYALLLYNKSGGKVLPGLSKRRAEEQEMYNSCDGFYPKAYTTVESMYIDNILLSIGVEPKYLTTWRNRKPIADANGIKNYRGTAVQNQELINLAKEGKLKRV